MGTVTAPVPAIAFWHWRTRLAAWWKARLPHTDNLLLTQRNVYILPTRAGWMLAATLAVLLVASINYQLNLGYLLTFLLAGCAAAGMVVGHGTLRGLNLLLDAPGPLFAGQQARCIVRLVNARRTPRLAIGLALLDSRQWAWTDVPASSQAQLEIGFKPARRGLHPMPALIAETHFPLGSFRVWAIWQPAAQLLVYPEPEPMPPPLPAGEPRAGSGTGGAARPSAEFDGVRGYQRGDPLKLVVWKKFARSGELVSRDTEHAQRSALWLDFGQTGAHGVEQSLSRLAAWVLAADAAGLDYGLRLPGTEIALDGGSTQRQRCLRALAIF